MNFIEHFGLNALLSSLDGIAYLVGYIAGLFVTVGGTLVNWTLSQNATLLTSNTVQTGFIVSRDLANLGFVLAIILIAFATILRFEQYQMQRILWKLIVAALLVNFSLTIAGVFIDFSGVLTNFFIEKAAGGTVGEGLADAFNVQSILRQTEEESKIKALVQGLKEDPNKHYPFTASVVFVAIFTTIVAISLISLAAMLYIRYIWLTILLILAPLAWLMWIWPDLEHLQKQWWGKFMQWTIFGPAVTFFIYLAIAVTLKGGIVPVGSSLDAAIGVTIKDFGTMLAKMITVLGILYGGMYTANAMGIAGAGVGFAVAKGVKNLMVSGGTIAGAEIGTGVGRLYQGLNKTILGRDKTFTEDLRHITAAASGSKIPFVGRAMQTANRALATGAGERMEQYQKDFDGLDSEVRLSALNAPYLDAEKQAALINSIAKNNELRKVKRLVKEGKLSQGRLDSFKMASLERGGAGAKTLLSKDPFAYKLKLGKVEDYVAPDGTKGSKEKYDEAFAEGVSLSPEAIEFLDLEQLKDAPVFLAKFKGSHLAKMTERAPADQDEFLEIVKSQIENLKKQIQKGDEALQEELTPIYNKLTAIGTNIVRNPAFGSAKKITLAKTVGATEAPASQPEFGIPRPEKIL